MQFVCDGQRHLVCVPYSVENLHAMARELGIKRCWYHGGRYPHYDIPKGMIEAVEGRCRKVRPREVLKIVKGEGI